MSFSRKMILIYPRFPVKILANIPIGLLHLGTFIKNKGYDVQIIDCTIEENYKELIKKEISDAGCVGISAMTSQIPQSREICVFIKNELKVKIPIIFGGVHATLYPAQVASDPLIDIAVEGEGELVLLNILGNLEKGTLSDISRIPGVSSKTPDGIVVNKNTEQFDYAQLPEFDYSLLNQKVFGLYKRLGSHFPLLTSRGCPYRCAFCINVLTKNIRWRYFSAERTIAEIERITKMGFDKIWIWDENFFTSKERLLKIIDLLEARDLQFEAWAEGRTNYFREDYLNHELLVRLQKAGFKRIGSGFESGSQKILDYLQKDITVKQIMHQVQECSGAGIRISASFMIGLPAEDIKDLMATVDIIGKIIRISKTCGISGPILYRPYPGSTLYRDCLGSGWKEPRSLEEWVERVEQDFSDLPNPYKLPWIKYPSLVNFIHFYTFTLTAPFKNLILMFWEYCRMAKRNYLFFLGGAFALLFLSILGKIRYRIGFYQFLIEKKIFSKYHPNLDY